MCIRDRYKICFWTDFTGRNEESIKLHQAIIEDYPFSELAWFNLAAAYQGLKLYEKSIDAYQYAVAIDEKFDYAYRNMGDAFLRLRKYKEAIEAVSYTHLDVYKRQAKLNSGTVLFIRIAFSKCLQAACQCSSTI